jgi:LruC domain-containing protein
MKHILIVVGLLVFSLALFAQGTIAVWGNPHSQVARNVPEGEDFVQISAGYRLGIALRADGSVVTWGQNSNNVVNQSPAGFDFTAISAGQDHALALRSDGSVIGWGNNDNGMSNSPPHSDYVKISAGISHNLALRANGEIHAWGNSANGRLDVPAGTYIDIAAGNTYSLAINTAGELVGWGAGWNGELNLPAGNDFVQVSAKYLHCLARRADGSIEAWGNVTGNLDVPAGTYQAMDAGWQGNVALTTDDVVVNWANLWVLKTVPAWVHDLDIVKIAAGDEFYLGLTGDLAETDSDGDGVVDALDEFPDDPSRAYSISYPLDSPTGWGTLAFEDLWPQQGDYDFNDLVLGYQLSLILDAELKIKDILGDFQLRAVGATFQNAFAIEFPFAASNIEPVTGLGAGMAYDMPLTDAGPNSVLTVISNTNDFVTVPGSGVLWNTQLDQPTFDPIPISFELTLTEAIDQSTLPLWGFWNPFLMVNRDPGHEIHLPGYPPTIFADPSLFGAGDDTTDPGSGRYYKTSRNLPWALDLPINWHYTIEHKEITHAYYGFAPWAESGGNIYQNWYELIDGQINPDYIYNP